MDTLRNLVDQPRLPFIAAFGRPCSVNLMGMCDAPQD